MFATTLRLGKKGCAWGMKFKEAILKEEGGGPFVRREIGQSMRAAKDEGKSYSSCDFWLSN